MGYRRRYSRRRYRGGGGVKLSPSVALVARELQKGLRDKRMSEDLAAVFDTNYGIGSGKIAQQALFNTFTDPSYHPRRIHGRGGYNIKSLLRTGAHALGGMVGGKVGASLAGSLAGAALSGGHHQSAAGGGAPGPGGMPIWAGSGAYHSTNQLVNPSGPSRDFHTAGDETNDITINHREYLTDISGPNANFNSIYSALINPGLATSFPWLSQIAMYYEEYEFIQLLYTFESMVTDGNQNAGGTIIMCTQYNPTNQLFNNKNQMEMYEHAQSFKVTSHAVHGVECDPVKRAGTLNNYVRTGPVPFGQDPKSYDIGVFQFATNGVPTTLNLGELWVTYSIRLSKSKIPLSGTLPGLPVSQAFMSNAGTITAPTGNNILGLPDAINQYQFAARGYDSTNTGVAYTGTNVLTNGFGFNAQWLFTNFTRIFFPAQIDTGLFEIQYQLQLSGTLNPAAVTTLGFANPTNCSIIVQSQTGGTTASSNRFSYIAKILINASGTTQASVDISNPSNVQVFQDGNTWVKVQQINQTYTSAFVY